MQPVAKSIAAACTLLALAGCSQATEAVVSSRSAVPPSGRGPVNAAERACLTEAIYFEATVAPDSQAAVANVILNRAEDPRFPDSVCGVVRDGCQFSYRCADRPLALTDRVKRTGAQRTAEAVLTGAPDPTRGALFFHSAAAAPGWFASRPRVGEIGGNVFYR